MQKNLTINQGETFVQVLEVRTRSGDPVDLTDQVGTAQLRKSFFSTAGIDFDVEITDPANGQVQLTLSSSQTSLLDSTLGYVWDLFLTKSDGTRWKPFYGNAWIRLGATKFEE